MWIEVFMITWDNKDVAQNVAMQLWIDRFFAEVLPQDKSKYIEDLQKEWKFVAMVWDGINDATALAQADIWIAIGAWTDVAIETWNIVLMKSDPLDIIKAIKLSKATIVKMKQNLFWAVIYNLLAIPVAAWVFYTQFWIFLRPELSAILMIERGWIYRQHLRATSTPSRWTAVSRAAVDNQDFVRLQGLRIERGEPPFQITRAVLGGNDQGRSHGIQYALFIDNTAGTVRARMYRSSHTDQRSM